MRPNGLIGTALAVSGTFAISWLGAIAYWRSGVHAPGPAEVAGLLLGLPAALLASAAWWRRSRRSTQSAGSSPDSAVDATAGEAALAEPPRAIAAVPALSVNLPCGDRPAGIIEDRHGLPALDLHPTLRDTAGMPVFAACIGSIDPTVPTQLGDSTASSPVRPEWLRALAAADPVVHELLGQLIAAPAGLLALVPAEWSEAECERAGSRLRTLIPGTGLASPPWIRIERTGTGAKALALVAEVAPPVDSAETVLCVAMASHIGERTVTRWAAARRLLGSANPQGQAPGEGAAGIALCAPAAAPDAPIWIQSRQRQGGKPRDRGALMADLIGSSLREAAIDADAIGLLVSNADHRTEGLVEIGAALSSALPGFDAHECMLHLGQSCGDAGAVPTIASLALAASACESLCLPTLALSLDDGERSLAVFAPASRPAIGAG